MKPPTLQQVIDYCREKSLAVDPEWFYNFFDCNDWIDSRDNPVKSWKQKLWTHHRMTLERGGMPRCCKSGCKKPGVYIIGKDRDGHPYKYCIDHKPQPKPLPLPDNIIPIMKKVPSVKKVNVNNERNRQQKDLEAG